MNNRSTIYENIITRMTFVSRKLLITNYKCYLSILYTCFSMVHKIRNRKEGD